MTLAILTVVLAEAATEGLPIAVPVAGTGALALAGAIVWLVKRSGNGRRTPNGDGSAIVKDEVARERIKALDVRAAAIEAEAAERRAAENRQWTKLEEIGETVARTDERTARLPCLRDDPCPHHLP